MFTSAGITTTIVQCSFTRICRFLIGLPSSSGSSSSSSASVTRSGSGSSSSGVNEKTSPSPWVYVTIDGQHISCRLYVYSVRTPSVSFRPRHWLASLTLLQLESFESVFVACQQHQAFVVTGFVVLLQAGNATMCFFVGGKMIMLSVVLCDSAYYDSIVPPPLPPPLQLKAEDLLYQVTFVSDWGHFSAPDWPKYQQK